MPLIVAVSIVRLSPAAVPWMLMASCSLSPPAVACEEAQHLEAGAGEIAGGDDIAGPAIDEAVRRVGRSLVAAIDGDVFETESVTLPAVTSAKWMNKARMLFSRVMGSSYMMSGLVLPMTRAESWPAPPSTKSFPP